ncbi:MAG: phosphate propanoyltransferase [Oscillospiraceae bacterium]|jgi:putative phosphotransacetylase|nr:phosphate propanoyltransferase [Oscillospiraceae bacterium]
MKIPIEVSARHVHLSKDVLELIFGKGYSLRVKKNLSQPGQFLSEEKIDIIVGKQELRNVSVLGPERDKTQIEISMTDARKLKINPVIRESGNLSGSTGCTLRGPKDTINVKEGLIVAKRHIHMKPEDASKFKVLDGEVHFLKTEASERFLIFGEIIIRVSNSYSLAAHIDTDESNASGITEGAYGILVYNRN